MTHSRWYVPWLFVIPALLVIGTFVIYPFIGTIQLAFTNSTMLRQGDFVGLDNFRNLFSDRLFMTALRNSTMYTIIVVPILVIAPLILAALVRRKSRVMGFFRTAYYLPVLMSAVVVGLIWTNQLHRTGLINETLQWLQVITAPIPFLGDPQLLLFSAMFVTIWTGLGFYMVMYLASLAHIDDSLYEAAAIDGAGPIRQFFSVTMPAVRSTMLLVCLLSSIAAFRVFGEIFVLSGGTGGLGGRAITMTMLIQREGTGISARTGYTAAISLVMFIVLGALVTIQMIVQSRQEK